MQALSGEGWRVAKLVGWSSGDWICLEPNIQSFCWLVSDSSSEKTTIKIFQIYSESTNPQGGAVLLAQQSVLPSIPQIWINHSV